MAPGFALTKASYTVARAGAGYTVMANSGGDGIDTLVNVEKLQFSDGTTNLSRGASDVGGDGKSAAISSPCRVSQHTPPT